MEFQRAQLEAMGQEAERSGWTDTGGLESHERSVWEGQGSNRGILLGDQGWHNV